jgi:hypothetical protein
MLQPVVEPNTLNKEKKDRQKRNGERTLKISDDLSCQYSESEKN